ncbi:hypothetical protein [Pseudomonas inefficax]|uniref:hypothetical protein n=1 Tax=Pseudomonas inefficax TaxID=2078786 RepID=UPI0035C60159
MTTTTRPVYDLKDSLHQLQHRYEVLASEKSALEKTTEAAVKAYRAASIAAKEVNKSLPDRFMCGQWLFVFSENGPLEVTEIPSSEPYNLIDIARSMGESDPTR